jgi:hypothetical protein
MEIFKEFTFEAAHRPLDLAASATGVAPTLQRGDT